MPSRLSGAGRSLGFRASGFAQAYGEGGDVVVKASTAVAEEVAVKSRGQFAWRCRGLSTHPSCQREELPVRGAGLGEPVRMEEQQVAGEVDGVVIADRLRGVERWRGDGRFEDTEIPAVQEQRRGVSAVEDVDTSALVRDLGEKGGGEAPHRPVGGKGGVVTGAPGVQPACDVDHVGRCVGRLPESVDDRRGRPHCRR